mgnify:CR=1 FL=1
MSLTLMYITNEPDIARIAENAGIDRIFVDMEYIGKSERQRGMDTVQSHHTISDVKRVKNAVCSAEVLVRVNPIHDAAVDYCSSEEEINAAVNAGADVIMLPFFKTAQEAEYFIQLVAGRAKTMLLVETPEAVEVIDDILKLKGIDEIHIGLNDLSLGYGRKFMFELLADGTVEEICCKLKKNNMKYGFGGIAALGGGALPAERIIREHYRLGSSAAIVSRSFCDTGKITDRKEIRKIFDKGIDDIRKYEQEVQRHWDYFEQNQQEIKRIVNRIVGER